jgi:ketosteroid isomerase-like protein
MPATSHLRAAIRTLFLMTLLAGTLHAQSAAANASALADTIRALETARGDALLHADTTALGRLIAPDFVEISRLGVQRTRADNIGDIASGALRLLTIRYDSLNVRVYGDVAVLTGIADNTGLFRGFPFAGKIRYTRVFVRRDGQWRAVLMQQTSMQ